MKNLSLSVAALLAGSAVASAGGLERGNQSVGILFEQGNRVELSFGHVRPNVSGTYAGGAAQSGNIGESFNTFSGAVKAQVNENVSVALIIDQPYGADVAYPATGTFGALRNTTAQFSSTAVTALAKYQINPNVSVYGGIKRQTVSTSVSIPGGGLLNYRGSGAATGAYGYVLGAAYEIPEIALRAALTYHSGTTHNMATTESSAFTGGVNLPATVTQVKMPKSVNLDFQTGIAPDTLLMAGVRYVDWTDTNISPNHYSTTLGRGALVSYTEPTYTVNLGLGRKFTDNLSGSVSFGYEKAQGGVTTNLAPTDGYRSISIGAKYAMGDMDLSGGIQYRAIGNATSSGAGGANGTFSGNSSVAVGMKLGYNF